MIITEYIDTYFYQFSGDLRTELARKGRLRSVDADQTIIQVGDRFSFIPLIVDGVLKVNRVDDEGNEHFLYFLYAGQTCTVTLNCCLSGGPSEVVATAEEDVRLIEIPIDSAKEWMDSYPDWRNFMLETYQSRFHELLMTVDQLAFQKLDARIVKFLQEKSSIHQQKVIDITHSQIAENFHTSREVVSRVLKIIEKKGEIELGRNKIRLK